MKNLFLLLSLILSFGMLKPFIASATTFYVEPSGNDANKGTEILPWRTLSHAVDRLDSGDTLILRGGVYKEYINIDVPGVIFKNYPGERPVIDGNHKAPDINVYLSQIEISANNVTIDGLEVMGSACYGVHILEGIEKVRILNTTIHDTYRQCLVVKGNNSLIQNCDVYGGGKVYFLWDQKISRQDPPQVTVKYGKNNTFRYNKFHDAVNENFDIGVLSSYTLVEFCELYGGRKNQLYVASSTNNIIRYNLIYGVHRNKYGYEGRGTVGFGHEHQWVEKMGNPLRSNSYFYGNFVANTAVNIWIKGNTDRQVSNVYIFNNTFVEAFKEGETAYGFLVQGTTGGGHVFKNNIIWQTTGISASIPPDKVDCDNNLWSKLPDANAIGKNDPPYALPILEKSYGWNALSGGDLKWRDFNLKDGSPAIDAGQVLAFENTKILNSESPPWQPAFQLYDQSKFGNGWEIGADIHLGLTAPERLKIKQ